MIDWLLKHPVQALLVLMGLGAVGSVAVFAVTDPMCCDLHENL